MKTRVRHGVLFIVIVFHAIGKFCKWDNGAGVAWKALIRNFWNSLLMLLAISACSFCFAGTLKSAMRKHCWSFRRLPIRRVQLGSALASTLSGKGLCTNTRQSALKVENSKQASLPLLRARAKRQARLMHVNIPESNSWEKERQKRPDISLSLLQLQKPWRSAGVANCGHAPSSFQILLVFHKRSGHTGSSVAPGPPFERL